MADAPPPAPRIRSHRLTVTHDGESALLVEIGFPGGGCSWVQIADEDVMAVMRKADVSCFDELIGQSWEILRIRGRVDRERAGFPAGSA